MVKIILKNIKDGILKMSEYSSFLKSKISPLFVEIKLKFCPLAKVKATIERNNPTESFAHFDKIVNDYKSTVALWDQYTSDKELEDLLASLVKLVSDIDSLLCDYLLIANSYPQEVTMEQLISEFRNVKIFTGVIIVALVLKVASLVLPKAYTFSNNLTNALFEYMSTFDTALALKHTIIGLTTTGFTVSVVIFIFAIMLAIVRSREAHI